MCACFCRNLGCASSFQRGDWRSREIGRLGRVGLQIRWTFQLRSKSIQPSYLHQLPGYLGQEVSAHSRAKCKRVLETGGRKDFGSFGSRGKQAAATMSERGQPEGVNHVITYIDDTLEIRVNRDTLCRISASIHKIDKVRLRLTVAESIDSLSASTYHMLADWLNDEPARVNIVDIPSLGRSLFKLLS